MDIIMYLFAYEQHKHTNINMATYVYDRLFRNPLSSSLDALRKQVRAGIYPGCPTLFLEIYCPAGFLSNPSKAHFQPLLN